MNKKIFLLLALVAALALVFVACEENVPADTQPVTEAPTEEATEAPTEESITAAEEVTTEETTTEEVTTEEVTTEEVTTEEVTTAPDNSLKIDISKTTAVATDAAWIPNQHMLGPHNMSSDTTGQINAINLLNNGYLGDTGYGNIIVGGYISVDEVDLSQYKSVTIVAANGLVGHIADAWLEDAEGNKLNAEDGEIAAGDGSNEGTQTLRTITIDLDSTYKGEVRFLFTQTDVVTIVAITFNA